MASFLQKYSTPYFAKVFIAGNKTTRDLPKYGGKLNGKRNMFMHHILEKCRNPNFSFYHAQEKEFDAKYPANVCTVIARVWTTFLGMVQQTFICQLQYEAITR